MSIVVFNFCALFFFWIMFFGYEESIVTNTDEKQNPDQVEKVDEKESPSDWGISSWSGLLNSVQKTTEILKDVVKK